MGFSPLETTPLLEFFPLGSFFLVLRFLPLSGLYLHSPLIGFLPLGDDNMDLPTSPFSISLQKLKPSADGISPHEFPSLL